MYRLVSLVTLILIGSVCQASPARELSSLGISDKQRELFVDAHFEDRDRTTLTIEASYYRISIFLPQPKITAIVLDGENVIREGVMRAGSGGAVYTSGQASRGARPNIWRHGPYYYEVHILDIRMSTADGKDLPIKGELAFYCYPEKFHVQAGVKASEDVSTDAIMLDIPLAVSLRGGETGKKDDLQRCTFGNSLGKPAFAAVAPVGVTFARGGEAQITANIPGGSWKKGERKSVWFAVLPAHGDTGRGLQERVQAEVSPLGGERFLATSGGAVEAYDAVRGHYVLRTMPALANYGFERFWVSPNQYLTVSFKVGNDDLKRRIYVKHYTPGDGMIEAAVVTDKHGFPLPLPIQACKNFPGEGEEPDDTAYSESYFPLSLGPDQALDLRSYQLVQNWGNHPLKQVSSIRFFQHYYHLSTGATETTCYVPFTKIARPGAGYTIADFRGLSGIMWLGQPEFHHVALIGFLQYYDGEWRNLRYLNTQFEYISPNLAKFTMNYMSDDDKIKASVRVMEIPQLDETRSFVHIRYDVLKPVEIQGDARHNLRFVNANTDITRNRYQKVAYLAEDNQAKEVDLKYDDSWILEGVPLGQDHPFICLYASPKGNNSFIVLNYQGMIGGKPLERLATSAVGYSNHVAEQFLTVSSTDGKLLPGDYLEADVILMPYGYDWHDWRVPDRERTYYGSNGPSAEALHGTKLADFPAEIEARDGYAEFQVSGGHDYLPLIVKRMRHYDAPMLWEKVIRWNFVDQQVRGNDWYQVVAGEDGFDFVFLIRQRNGIVHHYMVTQASCDSPIESIRAENGEVAVRAEKPGRMEIVSPRLFDGLVNRVRVGSEVIRSTGIALEARTIPVLVSAKFGSANVKAKRVGQDGYDIDIEGRGNLEFVFGYLADSGSYTVQTADGVKTVSADRIGVVTFPIEVRGRAVVKLRPAH